MKNPLALLLTLCTLLVLSCASCASPYPMPSAAPTEARTKDPKLALVTLVRFVAEPRATWGVGAEPGWSGKAEWQPYCTAFGVKRMGRVQLATAAHCVPEGGRVHYLQHVGFGQAVASFTSEARDVAYLDPSGDLPATLELAPMPPAGAHVGAYSSTFEPVSTGRVVTEYVLGFYETSQTIVFGWSGSPVVDDLGRVVGVVSKCPTTEGQCTPGHTIVASLL